MSPPHDGDEVAVVIPLRQRQEGTVASPPARQKLPRERAAFDPELEPGDVLLKRRANRRRLVEVASSVLRGRPRFRSPASGAALARGLPFRRLRAAAGLAMLVALALIGVSMVGNSPRPRAAFQFTAGAAGQLAGVDGVRANLNGAAGAIGRIARLRFRTPAAPRRGARSPAHPVLKHVSAHPAASASATSGQAAGYTPIQHPAVVAQQSSTASIASSSQGSSPDAGATSATTRPAFGMNGTLGPGHSPNS